jgi:hypothetical protein
VNVKWTSAFGGSPFSYFNHHEVIPQLAHRQISLCVSKISHFRKEIFHFPARENFTGSCENPFSQLPLGAASLRFSEFLPASLAFSPFSAILNLSNFRGDPYA